MIIKTSELKKNLDSIKIAFGVDKNASDLEIIVKNNRAFLNVSNREFFLSTTFEVEDSGEFRATVDTQTFLNLINTLNSEEIDLTVEDKVLKVKSNKSKYNLNLKFDLDEIKRVQPIRLGSQMIELDIPNSVLDSILTINAAEVKRAIQQKLVGEAKKHYLVSNEGCFTYSTGVCLNQFSLDKEITLVLNDRIVKLFKLFKDDVHLTYGVDEVLGSNQYKIVLTSQNLYLAALITNNSDFIAKMQSNFEASKRLADEAFKVTFEISQTNLQESINRLISLSKNATKADEKLLPVKLIFNGTELYFTDKSENCEYLESTQNTVGETSEVILNLYDLDSTISSLKDSDITIKFGHDRVILVESGNVRILKPVLPESAWIEAK